MPVRPQPISLLRLLLAATVVAAIAWTHSDADLWGHVLFGGDILDAGEIPDHDPYSFTSDKAWVNHEWLSEVVMALAFRAAGGAGLVVLKTAAVVTMMVLVAAALRRQAWRLIDHDLLIAATLVATFLRVHFLRPQVFSLLLFAALLLLLTGADRGRIRALLAVPPIMALWANLHGGWLMGFLALSVWAGVRFLRVGGVRLPRSWVSLTWAGALVATLVNAYGAGLWTYLRDNVGTPEGAVVDWMPLFELPPLVVAPVLVMTLTAVVAVGRAGRRIDPANALIVLVFGLATLRVGRFDAFYGLAVVMLLGPYLGRRSVASAPAEAVVSAPVRVVTGIAALAGALAATVALTSTSAIGCVSVRTRVEAQATRYLYEHHGNARLLTHFDWGQYAIWHLAPAGVKVSMDGRHTTVYSDEMVDAHIKLYDGDPGSLRLVARLRPDVIWLPRRLSVVERLRRLGWRPALEGPESVILERRRVEPPVVVGGNRGPRCFPAR